MEADKPVLGVCRGMQLLNVALGGTLWQDLATQKEGLVRYDPRGDARPDTASPFAYGVQWHPEFHDPADPALLDGGPILSAFLRAVQARRGGHIAAGDDRC